MAAFLRLYSHFLVLAWLLCCTGKFGLSFSIVDHNIVRDLSQVLKENNMMLNPYVIYTSSFDTLSEVQGLNVCLAAPMVERLRALFLNHLIISPLCLMWVRAPIWPHVRQAKFCLRVCQVVFLGALPFSPQLLIGPSHMS